MFPSDFFLPVVSADEWQDVEEPHPSGAQPKLWVRRHDGRVALFKEAPQGLPAHVTELVAGRLALALGLNTPLVQLFSHDLRGWGALSYRLPSSSMNFADLPEAAAIRAGQDRLTLVNDGNIRCMPIFDAMIHNGDRHDQNHMVCLEIGPDAAPRRYLHWLIDHGYSLDGGTAPVALEAQIQAAGGTNRYIKGSAPRLQADLEYAHSRWWETVEPFCRMLAESAKEASDDALSQVPQGLLPAVHRSCIRERIQQAQMLVTEFVERRAT